ncbi:MAG TPA: AmmeMemoRadiSam system protein A [Pyrinomonadaceae bacterium]|nr:AmmeMemoRadiSam system protein A [Pyrinomonadaceae bacterium]
MTFKAKGAEELSQATRRAPGGAGAHAASSVYDDSSIHALARRAVETFISQGRVIEQALAPEASMLSRPAACFVCIKTLGRELRGCIGTFEPEKSTLAEEVVANAIKAATRDPRFRPLSRAELPALYYSVDVLGSLEPARFEELDPAIFGVLVVARQGSRRGLLLPNIESIRTADAQVRVAAEKASIRPDEPLKLYRFRTRRFSEWD